MSKKAKSDNLKIPEMGNFDAGNFDIGEFDVGGDDVFSLPGSPKSRNPVLTFGKGVKSGMIGHITSEDTIKKFAKGSLSKEYGKAIDHSFEAVTQAKSLYDDAVREVKPNLAQIARSTEKLIPNRMKRSKAFFTKIREWMGDYDTPDRSEEGEIQDSLKSIFAETAMQDERNRAEDEAVEKIDRQVDHKRFNTNLRVFSNMSYQLDRLANYNAKINSAYQRKSLELQYRTYFANRDLLEETKKHNRGMTVFLEAIQKNTGLPDYAKITTAERMKDRFKSNLGDMATKSLFGDGEFMKKGFDNLRQAGLQKIQRLGMILSQTAMGLDQATLMKEIKDQMEEAGMPMDDLSLPGIAGNMTGSGLLEGYVDKLGRWINSKTMAPGSKGERFGHKISKVFQDPRGSIHRFRKKGYLTNPIEENEVVKKFLVDNLGEEKANKLLNSEGFVAKNFNRLLGALDGGLDIFAGNKTKEDSLASRDSIYEASNGGAFDNRTKKAIELVIPGYLSRIFRELQVLRTGDAGIGLTEFDYKREKFSGRGQIKLGIDKHLRDTFGDNGQADKNVQELVKFIVGSDRINKDQYKALKSGIKDSIHNDDMLDVDFLKSEEFLSKLPSGFRDSFEAMIDNRFNKEDSEYEKKDALLNYTFNRARDSYKNISGEIQAMINAGQAPYLVELGVLTESNGQYRINDSKYRQYMDKGKLRVDANRIKVTPGSGIFKNTPKSDTVAATLTPDEFVVTEGATDRLTPSALEIINSADQPGMTKEQLLEDLTNAIPHFAKGGRVRRSKSSVKGLVAPSASNIGTILSGIKADTGKLVELTKKSMSAVFGDGKMNLGGFGKPNLDFSGFNKHFSDMSISDIYGKAKYKAGIAYDNLKDIGLKGVDFTKEKLTQAKEYYDANKDRHKATAKEKYKDYSEKAKAFFSRVYHGGMDLLSSSYDRAKIITSDIINNKIPKGIEVLKDFYAFGKDKLNRLVSSPIDIYVKGQASPTLLAVVMRGGGYFDQATGKRIYDPGDIAGPVINASGEVVLTLEDIRAGLVDTEGQPIRTLSERVKGHLKDGVLRGYNFTKNLLKNGLDALGPAGKKLSQVLQRATGWMSGLFSIKNLTIQGDMQVMGRVARVRGGVSAPTSSEATETTKEDTQTPTQETPSPFNKVTTALDKFSPVAALNSAKGKIFNVFGSVTDKLFGKTKTPETDVTPTESMTEEEKIKHLKFKKMDSKERLTGIEKKAKTTGRPLKEKLSPKEKLLRTRAFNDTDGNGVRDGDSSEIRSRMNKERDERNAKIEAQRNVAVDYDKYRGGGALMSKLLGMGKAGLSKLTGLFDTMSETDLFNIPDKDLTPAQRKAKEKALLKKHAARKAAALKGAGKKGLLRRGAEGVVKGASSVAGKILPGVVGAGRAVGSRIPLGSMAMRGAGMAAGGAITAGKIAGTALTGGRAAMLARGAFMLGDVALTGGALTAIGSTGIGSAIGGGLATAGTAIAGVLSAPVVLGVLAAAAIGYGGYKAYKYFNRNKASKLVEYRMMQYGLAGLKDKYHLIFELEEYLEKNAIGTINGAPSIMQDKVDVEKVLGIFGVDKDDPDRLEPFLIWMNQRFKPVFCSYLAALKGLNIKSSLSEIDDLKIEFKNKLVSMVDVPQAYSVNDSPFDEPDRLNTSTEQIAAAKKLATEEISQMPGAKIAGKITSEIKIEGGNRNPDGTLRRTRKTAEEKFNDMSWWKKALLKSNPFTLPAMIVKSFVDTAVGVIKWLGYDVSPIEAVRFKTYGMHSFSRDMVNAVRHLERYVSEHLTGNAQSGIMFNGDIEKVVEEVSGKFGLMSVNDEKAPDWVSWFTNRFMPVFKRYIAFGYQKAARFDIEAVDSVLTDEEKYYAAIEVSSVDVWSLATSPWDLYNLNTDKNSTKENIELLKSKLKNNTLTDPRRKGAGVDKATITQTVTTGADTKKTLTPPPPATGMPDAQKELGDGKDLSSGNRGPNGITLPGNLPELKGKIFSGENADKYLKLASGVNLTNIHPELLKNLRGMAEEYGTATGKSLTINSGYRSTEYQRALYNRLPKGQAAPPGTSLHEYGLALDADQSTLNEMDALGLMRKYGFTRPVGGEPWHMEPAGIQSRVDAAKQSAQTASELIAGSLGRGGGGYGTTKAKLGSGKDDSYALALLNAGSKSTTLPTAKENVDTKLATKPSENINDNISKSRDAQIQKQNASGESVKTLVNYDAEQSPGKISQTSNSRSMSDMDPVGAQSKLDTLFKTEVGSDKESIKKVIAEAAKIAGVDPDLLMTIAAMESSLNPSKAPKNTSAKGLFGFLKDTWDDVVKKYGKKYGITPGVTPMDPKASALMAAEYIKANRKEVASVSKDPGAVESYIAHVLGPGGGRSFLKADENSIGAKVLPDSAKTNPDVFLEKNGRARTIGEIRSYMESRLANTAREFGISSPVASAQKAFKAETIQASASKPVVTPVANNRIEASTPTQTEPRGVSASYRAPSGDLPGTRTREPEIVKPFQAEKLYDGLNKTNQILTETLDTDRKILETLSTLAQSMTPENLIKALTSLKPSDAPKEATPQTRSRESRVMDIKGIDPKRMVGT